MSERFLKFIPSEEAIWLMHKKPNAFRLLMHIANTARRANGHPDGLIIGQCHLQSWTFYDLTEQEYRTAKDILVKRKHIIIIETNRTRKKSTTGVTTNSTLVQLCSSTVWDINPYESNDQINDRATTEQRPSNDKQEGIRRNKKEKENKQPLTPSFSHLPQKIKFREHVELSQSEHDFLLAKHGQEFFDRMLDALDSYKGSTGKVYKSDFYTMKDGGWVVERVKKEILNQKSEHEKSYKNASRADSGQDIKPSSTKFQPGRVLRGGDAGSVDQGGEHE